MFKYIFCLAIFILLSDFREDQSILAKERLQLAKENDDLARCKLFSIDKKLYSEWEMCVSFVAKDDDCKSFPEQKPECPPFLTTADYSENKYFCSNLQSQSKHCNELVTKKLWYSSLLDYKENWVIRKVLGWFDIDLNKKWFEIVSTWNLKIKIAVVAPGDTKKEFYQGVEVAVEEINNAGGVFGRLIETVNYPQHVDVEGSKEIANEIVHDTSLIAAISAQTSEKTKPVTKIYERGGIFNLITSATNMDILNSDMKYTFRMIPNNVVMAENTAKFMKRYYKKVAVVTENSAYAEELSNAFYKAAVENGISIGYSKNFDRRKTDFSSVINELVERHPEVIYFSGRYMGASRFLTQMRNMKIDTPFVGTESLDAQNFIDLVGKAGEEIVIPSVYNEKLTLPEHLRFIQAYKNKFGVNPNAVAVQGYDSMKLLGESIETLKTTVPEELSSIGHFDKDWYGAGGKLTFDKAHGIKKEIFFKRLHLGEYQIIDN